jgi:hypothetical protein
MNTEEAELPFEYLGHVAMYMLKLQIGIPDGIINILT